MLECPLSDETADRVFDVYLTSYEAGWSLFPDVEPCLGQLSRHRLGVVSNGQSRQQRSKLERMGISERFDHVVISEDCGFAKPSPEIFLRACALFDEQPQRVLYVGDMYDLDAAAARQAGLAGVWLDRCCSATAAHVPPFVQSLDGLARLVAASEHEAG